MRRILPALIILLSAGAASAQTADDLVDKSLAAQGGRDALEKLTSRSTSGKIAISTQAGEFYGTIEVLNQAPNKSRTLITLDLSALGAGSATIDNRFDGTNGYSMDSLRGNSDITGGRLENLRNSLFPTPLLTYKQRGVKVALAGKEKIDGRAVYVLAFSPSTGPGSRVSLDAESYLPVRTAVTLDTPEAGSLEQTTEYSDFRVVDGVKLPFRLKTSSPIQTFSVVVTKIEHNVTIDPALFAKPGATQSGWFQPALLERPDVKKAMQSVDDRGTAIVDEWIKLVEIPAPSKKEQARAQYIKAEMEKLGLTDIKVDDFSNVSGIRKGTGGGPTVVFAAHMDTVFPEGTDLKVSREGDILKAPGVGDDTSNLMATLEMFRALNRGGVQTKGDLVFLASVQEELGLVGARHWLETSGYKPDMFIAVDLSANQVWYGALRITQYKFFYTSPGAHTMESRGGPSPAKAVAAGIDAVYEVPLPPIAEGLDSFKLPVANVGMIGGGTVFNAVPREAWFTVDLRSLDTPTQLRLEQAVEAAARHAADQEKVGFRMEKSVLVDYAKAKPKDERLNSPLVQTALAVSNHFRRTGTPVIKPADVGSTDANNAIAMGIPTVAVGAVLEHSPHRLEETAEASSIVPGVKSLIALAVAVAR